MDRAWWRVHLSEVKSKFRGELYSIAPGLQGPQHVLRGKLGSPGNSGAGSILLADYYGAARIVLIGYDCRRGPHGEVHHHGDHPKGLGNAGSLPKWPKQFADVAKRIGAEVINCSPGTALDAFPRGELSEVLDS